MHDVKDQIRDYFEHNVERFDVESLPEMLHGADSANDTRHGVSSATPLRRGWLIAAAAAVAVLLVLGGSTLLLGTFRTSAPVTGTPTTTQGVVTTTTLEVIVAPTTVEQVLIDVAVSVVPGLGKLTWQRVDGDENTVPENIEAGPGGGYVSYEGSKVWRSDDGITWIVGESTPEFAGYEDIGFEDDWAIGWNRGTSQLFERDGDSWVPMQLDAASLPQISGITWNQRVRFPIESGGITVIYGSWWGQISWGDVYGTFEVDCEDEPEPCEEEPYGMWDAPSKTFRIDIPRTGRPLAVLSMMVDGQTISFVDTESGETVYTITGSADYPADAIADGLRRNAGLTYSGGWISNGGSEPVWTAFPWESADGVVVVPDGGFAAYEFVYDWAGNPDAPLVSSTMWTSSDGRNWLSNGQPPFSDGSANFIAVQGGTTQMKASAITGYDDSTGREFADTWVSTDGVAWQQVESVFPMFVEEHKTDFGWAVSDPGPEGFQFWVSTDGATWYEVEGPGGSSVPDGPGGGYGDAGAAGSILWGAVGNDNGPRTLWIGTFEPTP